MVNKTCSKECGLKWNYEVKEAGLGRNHFSAARIDADEIDDSDIAQGGVTECGTLIETQHTKKKKKKKKKTRKNFVGIAHPEKIHSKAIDFQAELFIIVSMRQHHNKKKKKKAQLNLQQASVSSF